MFANYSVEIKIAIFQPFRNANVTYEDRPKIAGAWLQKLHVLTAVSYTHLTLPTILRV